MPSLKWTGQRADGLTGAFVLGLRVPCIHGRESPGADPPIASDGSALHSSEPLSSVVGATAGPSATGGSRACGRRLAPGMKRKLLIAFAVAGLLTAAAGPSTLPAGAASHILTVKLLSGQLLTYQLPDGAPCETTSVPDLPPGTVVVGCQEVATPTTPTTNSTPTTATTNTTSTAEQTTPTEPKPGG